MYGSEKYRVFSSCDDPVYLPSLDYIGFTSRWRLLFEVAQFNMINSALDNSRVFVNFFDE